MNKTKYLSCAFLFHVSLYGMHYFPHDVYLSNPRFGLENFIERFKQSEFARELGAIRKTERNCADSRIPEVPFTPSENPHDDSYNLAKSRGSRKHVHQKDDQKHNHRTHFKPTTRRPKASADFLEDALEYRHYDIQESESDTESESSDTGSDCVSVCSDYQFEASCSHPWCLLKQKYCAPQRDISHVTFWVNVRSGLDAGLSAEHNHPPFKHERTELEKQWHQAARSIDHEMFCQLIDSPEMFVAASITTHFDDFVTIFNQFLESMNDNDAHNQTEAQNLIEAYLAKLLCINRAELEPSDLRNLADHVAQKGARFTPTLKGLKKFLRKLQAGLSDYPINKPSWAFADPIDTDDDSSSERSSEHGSNPEYDDYDTDDADHNDAYQLAKSRGRKKYPKSTPPWKLHEECMPDWYF